MTKSSAQIICEYGPFPGLDKVHGLTFDGQRVWFATGDKLNALDPESGVVVPLFNPREQEWRQHFEWIEGGTVIRGRTASGRATVVALVMNHPDMVLVRSLWVSAGWHPPTDPSA